MQDTIGLLGCKSTLLAHVRLAVHQDLQVLLCKTAFQLSGPQHLLWHDAGPSQVPDSALPRVELEEVPIGPLLQHIEVPLDGRTAL